MQRKQKRKGLLPVPALAAAGLAMCFASSAFAKPPTCPPGQRPGISGCRSGAPRVRLTVAPPADAAKPTDGKPAKNEATKPAPKPAPRPDSTLRPPNSLERADRRLLIQEIARLEGLVKMTHPKSPDRPQLLLRLAGAYSELATIAERDHTRLEIEVEEAERAIKSTQTNKQLTPETTGPSHRTVL
jgi:hypothetical protein